MPDWCPFVGETNIKNTETDPMTAQMVPRRARLKPEDFDKFGYTVGCPGCDQLQIEGSARNNHNEVCRDRIEAELMNTESGKDRVDKAKDRLDAESAEMVEEMADGPNHPKETSVERQQTQGFLENIVFRFETCWDVGFFYFSLIFAFFDTTCPFHYVDKVGGYHTM